MQTAAIITTASHLSQAIRASRDPLRSLQSVLNILAQGTDDDELCRLLEWLAAEAEGAAVSRDEKAEAKRAELEEDAHRRRPGWHMGHAYDRFFDPEAA